MRFAILVLCCLLLGACRAGNSEARDGDSLIVEGERVRLFAIDAPELDQQCWTADHARFACGQRARAALASLIRGRDLRCETQDRDRFGRLVSICFAGEMEINQALVEQGWALALPRFSRRYVATEDTARREGRGMWQGYFEPPWAWRERNPRR